jgi:serine/threonine protein kinase
MSARVLTCRYGHSWEYAAPGPVPEDLSAICPACTAAGQATLEHPARAEPPVPLSAEATAPEFTPGRVIAGFEILQEINRGGMGVIFKARQLGLNRTVALKVISPERLGSADAMRRFRREVQAAALLSHPNIVTVFHTDLDGPWPYLAMEFVPGIDLFKLVRQAGPLPVEDACYYTQQAAQGLQHAFEQGLVHRDIKPANLMVTPSPLDRSSGVTTARLPRVKILDLGLARVVGVANTAGRGSNLTQAGEFLGTPDFIAPEQAEDSRKADIRSDLYSLGCTLFFLLTADVPFPCASLIQKLRRQLLEAPPRVAARRPNVPPQLDDVIQKLLAADPAQRYQTPAELIEALDAVLHTKAPARAAPAPRLVAPPPPAGRPAAPAKAPSTHSPGRQVRAHQGGVQSLSLSADGQQLLSGGQDEILRLWEAGRLREIRHLAGDVGPVQAVALAPGGKWAVSCALRLFKPDMVVQLWDLTAGAERRRLRGPGNNLHCVAFSPDGRRVAAGSADHIVRVWTLDQQGSPVVCFEGHTGPVSGVAFAPGGDALLSASHDGTVRVWDSRSGAGKGSLKGNVGKVLAVALGGASKRIAVAGDSLRVRQANGSMVELTGHNGPVLCMAFSGDGTLLLSGGSDGSVRLWRAADGEEVRCLEGHADRVTAVALSPDGQNGYSASADGTIRRWPLT